MNTTVPPQPPSETTNSERMGFNNFDWTSFTINSLIYLFFFICSVWSHRNHIILYAKIKIMDFSTPNRPEWAIDTLQPGQVIDLIFEYGCQDMPMKRVVVPFSKSDFLARRVPDPKLSYC